MIGDLDTFGGLFKIAKGPEFYSAFGNYVADKKNQPFWDFFNTRRFRISPKVISSRVMNHWQENGLLPDECQEKGEKWRSFTLMDLIWVATVKELREMGVSFLTIKSAKKSLVSKYYSCDYGELEFYSALAYFKKLPCEILVFRDGKGEVGSINEINDTKEKYGMITHTSIPINGILQSIFKEEDLKPIFRDWIDLNNKEIKVLEKIKSKKYDEVTIKMDNGEILNLSGSESFNGKNKSIYELHKEGGDQDLLVKIRDGNVRHIKQSKIEKL